MNKRLLKHLFSAAFFLAAVVGIFISPSDNSKSGYRLDKIDLSEIPGINAADWDRYFKTSPVPHILLQKTNADIKKYVFSTADCGIVKHGYMNWVELFVIFDHRGKVENVILGRNIETPGLIGKMHQNGFFQQWNGSDKPREVQYVTGATCSSNAVSGGVSALQELLIRKNFFQLRKTGKR